MRPNSHDMKLRGGLFCDKNMSRTCALGPQRDHQARFAGLTVTVTMGVPHRTRWAGVEIAGAGRSRLWFRLRPGD
jgi:hypothetical protein